jgi:hypothetical protein
VVPRSAGSSWWIEATVWALAASGGLAVLLLFESPWLRVGGAVVLAATGLRAVLRIAQLALAPSLRTLAVRLATSKREVAGPLCTAPLAAGLRFGVAHSGSGVYLCAHHPDGRTTYLVELDEEHAPDYVRLGEWLGWVASAFR